MSSHIPEAVAQGAAITGRFSSAFRLVAGDAGLDWGPAVGAWARWRTTAAPSVSSFRPKARARLFCTCMHASPSFPGNNRHSHRATLEGGFRKGQHQDGVCANDECCWDRGRLSLVKHVGGRCRTRSLNMSGWQVGAALLQTIANSRWPACRVKMQSTADGRWLTGAEKLQGIADGRWLTGGEELQAIARGRRRMGAGRVRAVSNGRITGRMGWMQAMSDGWLTGSGPAVAGVVHVHSGVADCQSADAKQDRYRDPDDHSPLLDSTKMPRDACAANTDRARRAVDLRGGSEQPEWSQVALGPLAKLLTDRQIRQIHNFVDILLDWNKRMNLTTVVGRSAVMERHVEDSLALLPVITSSYQDLEGGRTNGRKGEGGLMAQRLRVVDVGTGAGLPGVILAIAKPEWDVTLMDSMSKRCRFLEEVVTSLALENATVVCSRAEAMGAAPETREFFDIVVARAVAELRVLAELCLPLTRTGGLFVAAKGASPEEEVETAKRALSLLGGQLLHVSPVNSTGPMGQRTAVVCLKKHPTSRKFPRPNNLPKRQPL